MRRARVLGAIVLVTLVLGAAPRSANPGLAITVNPMVLQFAASYGGETDATVAISNPGSSDEVITSHAFDWRTTRGGDFAIERIGTEHKRSLSPFLQLHPASIVLKAGETRSVQVVLHMPAAGNVAPVAWGGFLLQASPREGQPALTPGATIVVYNSTQQFEPRLQLTGFTARRDRNAAHFAATVKNAGQSYLRPTVHLTVVSGNTIARSIDIPFNAILPGDDRAIHAEVDRLHAGAYRAELTIDYGGDSIIEGETHVTIQ